MSNSFRLLCCVGLAAVCFVATATAQEKGQGRRPGGAGGGFGMRDPLQLPESLKITDEQKTKLADLKKKYEDKLKAVNEKAKLTEEQQGKMREVFTKFQATGKDRSEFAAFMAEELKLSAEQKKGREEQTALVAEITKEVQGLLTEEQKKQLEELRAQRRPGGGGAPGKRPERKKE
jgi:Spy/CpxP family protein refolding chaperone